MTRIPRQTSAKHAPPSDRSPVLSVGQHDAAVAVQGVIGREQIERQRGSTIGAKPGGVFRRRFGRSAPDLGMAVEIPDQGNVRRDCVGWLGPATEQVPAPPPGR
jgi:hypothetical protein